MSMITSARQRTWQALAGLLLLLQLALSTPYVGQQLLRSLEDPRYLIPPSQLQAVKQSQVIVVLGGGQHEYSPEYQAGMPNPASLVRLHYGAWLHRQTQTPLLLSGGRVFNERESEAAAMQYALQSTYKLHAKWLEEKSRNTDENIAYLSPLLAQAGVKRITLVTSAYHMPRALRLMAPYAREYGFTVIPAATQFYRGQPTAPTDWIPSGIGMRYSQIALHEWLALAGLWLRGK
ncbi:YdcF family protein [Parvibium lacunae]|nr:YdcF family protein [Parvibium lacunae]